MSGRLDEVLPRTAVGTAARRALPGPILVARDIDHVDVDREAVHPAEGRRVGSAGNSRSHAMTSLPHFTV
jgi:hypothetical protein